MDKITNQDPHSKSTDIVAENIEKLKALFPQIITEGDGKKRIDFDTLIEVLGEYVEEKEERYNFSWNGKSKARRLAQTPSTGTLRPCREESVDWDTTRNLFIEGDNLEVLKLLQKSYHKKVKMIYIDPPYNTGKEFIYPDKYKDNLDTYLRYTGQINEEGLKISANAETSGRYHTNWLNMMLPRLKLAKNLLRNDGLIAISIDDNEQANLRTICNQVFGEENFVDQIIWKKRYGGGAKEKHLITLHEYIVVYAKEKKSLEDIFIPLEKSSIKRYYKLKDNNFEQRGPYRTHPLEATKSMGERKNLVFPIIGPNGHEIWPKRQWLWSKERVQRALKYGEIEFSEGKNGAWSAHSKQYLYDEKGNIRKGKFFSIIDDVFSQHGTNEIIDLFGEAQIFSFPKPTGLLLKLLDMACPKGGLVVDLFAGSGSLSHATYRFNVLRHVDTNIIAVQLPEKIDENSVSFRKGYKTISDVGKERIRRAAAKIKEENPEYTGDLGFKVFKLDATNINPWEADFDTLEDELALSVDSIKEDRSAEDVLYEILLKYGLDLALPIKEHSIAGKTVYDVGMGALIVCLDNAITLEVVEGIGKLKEELQPEVMRVVFKDAGFADDVVKTNAIQVLKQFGIDDVKSL